TLALVGESGSGKSVTALSIMKLLPYPTARHPSGSLMFKGKDLMPLTESEMRHVRGNDISIIFQEPMTSLNPLHMIEKQIGEILLLHKGLAGAQARQRSIELLTQVGIPDPASRLASYPHQLSGGQRQRVMIAMALANEPDLLIADEPTTALDVTVQAQILTLLKELQTRLGMAMLFITHDLGIVRKLADRVCVMKEGCIVEHGDVARIFTAPEHPYTRALLAAEPKPNPAPLNPEGDVVVRTDNLKIWFPVRRGVLRKVVDHIKAVDGISIAVRKGETLGIVGESGSGKTTLGLAILRLISSDGSIVYLGDEIQGLRFKEMRPYRREMQVVFQDPFGSLSPRMSIADIIEEGLWVHHPTLSADEREQRVIRALGDVGLDPQSRFRYPHEYSGGQRQRIAIARAIVLEPSFVVLDEPTSALDMLIQSQIVDLLRDLQRRRHLTYMFISHDLRVVAALASRLIVMRHGRIVEEGVAADVFANPRHDYTRALFAAAFNLDTAPADVVAQ
ncbi:MAG: ABC transporter ATP-binding protein, partial [Proteobacteria bacterium]|nr:ABC transporter ATP-binding protein [Pseudomonadota bacterium]